MGSMEEHDGSGNDRDAALLAHVDLLYSVALRYTGDPEAAERLTEDTLRTAMDESESCADDAQRTLKSLLLARLRNAFVREYFPRAGLRLRFQI